MPSSSLCMLPLTHICTASEMTAKADSCASYFCASRDASIWLMHVMVRSRSILCRITKMSDEELVTAFKEMLQARKPGATLAASNSGPLGPLQQLPDRLQGFKLGWPWQQHQAPLPGSNDAVADSKVAEETGENTPTGSSTGWQEGSPSPAAARQSELESPKAALSTNQESTPSSSLPFFPRNETETPSGDFSRELPSLSIASKHTEKQEEARNVTGKDTAASEEADQTGSLLEASGLPFQLQEDGLPDVAPTGSQQITPGKLLQDKRPCI